MRDSFLCVGCDQCLVQQLLLLMIHVGNQKAEEDMQLLDFSRQNGVLIDYTIDDCISCLVDATDLHNVDTLLGGGAYGNKFAAHIPTSA